MQGTYWLTVLPETSQLRPRIKRALRGIDDDVRVNPTVDDRQATTSGRRFGGKFRKGFDSSGAASPRVDDRQASQAGRSWGEKFRKGFESSGAAKLGATARLIGAGFSSAAGAAGSIVRNVGTAATVIGVAARITKGFATSLLAASVGLKYVAGVSLAKVGAALGFAAHQAGRLATQVARVTSAILVLSAVGRVLGFMNRAAKMMSILTIGAAALIGVVSALASTLGGALVSALTIAGSAAGVAAGALAGILGPAMAVAKLGFKGLSEGAKAWQQTSAGGASTAKAVAAAARQVESAEKGVTRAKRDSKDAERDLTKARKDAANQIRDLNLELRGAALSEKDAQLSLLEARRDLQNLGRDGQPVDMIDRERAVLRVQEAEQRLAETQNSNDDLAEKADKANRAGIEGADEVVAAKRRVVDANDAIVDAEQAVTDARQAAADAASGGGNVDPFAAMIGQRMAPLLQSFKDLKMAVTDTFSGALTPAFGSLGGLIDGLKPRFTGLATTLGKIGSEVAGALASPANSAALDKMFAASDSFFSNFLGKSGISGAVGGLVQFAATAADTFKGVGAGINEQLLKFGEWLRGISPAQMILAFQALKQMVTNVWNVLGPVIEGIRAIGAVSAPALAPGFSAIGQAIKQAIPGLVQMSQILMPALSQVMERLGPVLPALVQAFTPWAGVLATIAPPIASVVAGLAPLAPLLLLTVGAFKAIGAAVAIYNTAMLVATNVSKVITAAMWLFNTALAANPIGIVVAAVVAAGVALWAFFTKTETGRALWAKIWTGIKTAAKVVADWFMDTAVPALKSAWDAIAAGAMWLWNNAIVPAFEGIKSAIEVAWSVIGPVWDMFKAGIELVGTAISWWWKNVTVPAFEAVKGAIQKFWTYAEPVWDLLTKAFDKVTTALTPVKDAFVSVFDKIKEVVKGAWDAVGWIFEKVGAGTEKITNAIKGVTGWIGGDSPPGHADGKPAGFASGRPATLSRSGRLSGPGTGTSDSILAMLSNGEGVVKTAAMNAGGGMGGVLVAALNSGWVPSAEFLHGMLPGYAEGLNPGADWLRTTIMQQWSAIKTIGGRRSEDGFGEHSSGNAIDVMIPGYNTADGKALGDQVASWVTKNKDALGADGMIWRQTSFGYGGDWTNGKAMPDRGSDTQNHMDHLHIILGKGRGAGAPSVDKPSSSISLPGGGSSGSGSGASALGASTSAGGGGGGSFRQATSGELANSAGRVDSAKNGVTLANQEVADRTAARDKAQRELDAAKAGGKDAAGAQRELDDANAELKDATDRQAKARDKAAKAEQDDATLRSQGVQDAYAAGSKSSGGGFDDLGKSLWGGLMETIGLDGSVFSNPFEWPTIKSVMAGVNVLGSALMGGNPGSATGAGGAGSVGGVLGGIADATGLDVANLNPAAAGVAAAPASAVAPDTTQHGAGAGAAPGPLVNIENAGMSPTDVSNKLSAEMNARTRTTKVN